MTRVLPWPESKNACWFWANRESTSELMETESEALKIADSISDSAKSAAGDLHKTQARRDGDPEHCGSAATLAPMTQLGDCGSDGCTTLFGHSGGYASAEHLSAKNWWRVAHPSSSDGDDGSRQRAWTKRWRALRHFAVDWVDKLL